MFRARFAEYRARLRTCRALLKLAALALANDSATFSLVFFESKKEEYASILGSRRRPASTDNHT